MGKLLLKLSCLTVVLVGGLIAAQCRPTPAPTDPQLIQPTPTRPQPALPPFPPIQPGDGSDLIDRLLETGLLRVGIRVWPEPNFSPPAFRGFSNAETGGALNGFEVDVARHLAAGLGLELELIQAYPPVIASGTWQGAWDVAIASLVPFDQSPPEAQTRLYFSKPYAYVPMGILIPAENNDIRTLSDLAGRRVGVLEHSPYQRLLTAGGANLTVDGQPLLAEPPPNLRVVPLSNLPKSMRHLGNPAENDEPLQIDAIFGPTPIFQEAIKSGFPVKLAPQARNLGVQPLAVATVPQEGLTVDRLIAEINNVLERLERQGTLAEIQLDWYGPPAFDPGDIQSSSTDEPDAQE
jgi:ABC-type amino acid transport substrate-binding protein